MTLNDLERRNSPYFAFLRNSADFQADYMTVVEDRPVMSVNHCLPVLVFYFWRKLICTLQRGLSAIAEHLVNISSYVYDIVVKSPRSLSHLLMSFLLLLKEFKRHLKA